MDIKAMHDMWLILTVLAIAGWLALLLRARSVLLPLKTIWPQMFRFFGFMAVAVIGTMLEMACADAAAYFYRPIINDPENLYLRLAGRAAEGLLVVAAVAASLVLDLGKKRG